MADGHEQQRLGERVGLVVEGPDAAAVVEAIVAAEAGIMASDGRVVARRGGGLGSPMLWR